MLENRLNLRRMVAISAIALASTGCAYRVKDHITGNAIGDVNQMQSPYVLDEVLIPEVAYDAEERKYSRQVYVQKTLALEDSLPILLYPTNKTERWIDRDLREVELKTTKAYLPRRVRNDKGEKAISVTLLQKAVINNPPTTGVSYDLIRTSEENVRYDLKTVDLKLPNQQLMERFYVVLVPPSERVKDESKFNSYIIPVKGTKIGINPDGEITLRNLAGFFRPELFDESKNPAENKEAISATKTEYGLK